MKKELNLFLTAVMFYTRLPVGRWVKHHTAQLNEATRYFTLVGWIAGALSAAALFVGTALFNPAIGVLFSMVSTVLLTGAFHEDGLADFCDGFGGGWTREKILEIMKDSRIGTYGVVGLLLLLSLKFLAIQQLQFYLSSRSLVLFTAFITAHALSRFTAASFIFTHTYVSLSDDSKAKPVAEKTWIGTLLIAALFSLIPLAVLVFLTKQFFLLAICIPLLGLKLYLGWYFQKWIGGYTGDCLGAAQQLAEVFIFLFFILIWKFT